MLHSERKNLSEGSFWKLAYNKLESLSQIFPIQISLPVNIFVQFAIFADFSDYESWDIFLTSNIPKLKSYQCIRIPIDDLEGEIDSNSGFIGL